MGDRGPAGLGPNGIPGNADWIAVGEHDYDYLGCPALGAGDINGDGLDDAYDADSGGTPLVPVDTDAAGPPAWAMVCVAPDSVVTTQLVAGTPLSAAALTTASG